MISTTNNNNNPDPADFSNSSRILLKSHFSSARRLYNLADSYKSIPSTANMNINKKLDRVKQWAGEKMGQESKTGVSEEFKALEMEMTLRHEGLYAADHERTSIDTF